MKRRTFLKTTGGMLALAGTPWARAWADAAPVDASGKPLNLLFITADDMNATMPGWMGNPHKPTPRMDAFAATCHRFVNNRDAAPICQPSREAMMTGLVPHHSGALGFNPIKPDIPTMVTVLRKRGYWTSALNKTEHMQPKSCFPWDMQFENSGKNPEMIGQEMEQALQAAKTAGKPFFINCNICDPHRPFYKSSQKPEVGRGDSHAVVDILDHEFTSEEVTVPSFLEDIPEVRKEVCQYYNSVQRLDLSFGKVLDALQASGEAENTVVVFVSDHGMPFPFSKATVFNNGPWCPVLLRWPGMGEPKVHEEMTGSIDIMPTLLDLMGVPKPRMDGRTWVPLLNGGQEPDRDYAISHVNSVNGGAPFPQRLVQTKTSAFMIAPWSDGKKRFHVESMSGLSYKAMAQAAKSDPKIQARLDQYILGTPMAFYDLVNDPDQRTNAINDPKHHDEINRLQQILLAYMERTNDPQLANYKTLLAGGTVSV